MITKRSYFVFLFHGYRMILSGMSALNLFLCSTEYSAVSVSSLPALSRYQSGPVFSSHIGFYGGKGTVMKSQKQL